MKQILIRKGQAVVAKTPAPSVTPGNVLVALQYSLISTGTEVAGLQRSDKTLLQKVMDKPDNIKKALHLVKEKGLGKAIDTVKMKGGSETPTGYSCAGRVVEVGKNIRDLKIGNLVACAGAGKANHAEFVSVPRNLTVKIPAGCTSADACSVTLGAIAMQGVRRADVRLGETVAVIGLGLIGQLTVQILKASGCRVIGVDIDQHRIDLACSLGADHGLNPAIDQVERRTLHITDGIGADATIITADSQSDAIVQQAMELTRKKGVVVIVGSVGLGLQRSPFYKKEINLLISCSYGPGRYDEFYEEKGIDYPLPYVRWTENRNMSAYLQLIASQDINFSAMVQKIYPLDQATEAFQLLKDGEKKPLAVLLSYEEAETKEKGRSPLVALKSTPISGRIRVGLIGCGSFAVGMHLPNLKALDKQYAIHALAGRDGAKVQTVGKQFGAAYTTTDYTRILADADIDMVLISTRHNLHAKMTIDALRASKAVFLEKPLATTHEDLDHLQEILTSDSNTQQKILVGFNRRFSPAAQRAKEILNRRINPAIIIYRVNAGYVPLSHWVHTEEGGGRIIGECCHMLDLFRFLIEHPAESVDVSSVSPASASISNIDNVVTTVTYQDGSLCTLIYTSLGSKEAAKETIEIYCDNRILTINDYQSLEVTGGKEKGWQGIRTDKGHVKELQLFADYLKGETSAPISLDELIETTQLTFLIDRMAQGGLEDAG